jgi:YegS/Rv2252/BmrU family lipid kinase
VSQIPLIIVNPMSRSGRTGREWASVEPQVHAALGPVEIVKTTGRRAATELAREAALRGSETIVAAGGDGTFSEVAAGVLDSGRAQRVALGLLPFGSGGDLPRTLGIDRALDRALEVVAAGRTRPIDVGRVRCIDRSGQHHEGWFVNEASVGLSADVARHVDRMPKRLGGRVAFAFGAARTIFGHRASRMCARVDDKRIHEGPTTLIAIANGCYFGGGMKIAPSAELDDGRLDVVVGPAFSRTRLLVDLLPRLYRGTHVSDPGIDIHRGQRVEIEPLGDAQPASVEADGELLGSLPASFEIEAMALRVLAPAP